jgi:hypothetical protein
MEGFLISEAIRRTGKRPCGSLARLIAIPKESPGSQFWWKQTIIGGKEVYSND